MKTMRKKSSINRINSAPNNLPAVPSIAEYKTVFLQIQEKLTAGQKAMLRAQFLAPKHTLTARQLANSAGYKNFNAANLQYGKIGNLLRKGLNYWDDSGQISYVLSWFLRPDDVANEWSMVMHKEVTQALQELRWFSIQQPAHYVQYHNSQIMGEIQDRDIDSFGISTSKSFADLIGSHIWLVSGMGKPRKYFLHYYFVADRIRRLPKSSGFKFSVSGDIGRIFEPAISISNLPWFKAFLKS